MATEFAGNYSSITLSLVGLAEHGTQLKVKLLDLM
jgi:hypothetical protein